MITKEKMLKRTLIALVTSSCMLSSGLFGSEADPFWQAYDAMEAGDLRQAQNILIENPRVLRHENVPQMVSFISLAVGRANHVGIPFIEWLIERGAPVMSLPSLLHNAIWFNDDNVECLQLLIRHGATVNDNHLQIAVACKRINCIRALLRCGANINAVNIIGCTPLHQAGTAQIAFLLLMHGPDVTIKDQFGRTALDLFRHPPFPGAHNITPAELALLEKIFAKLAAPHTEEECPVCCITKHLTFWGLCGHQVCNDCKNLLIHSEQANGILCPLCRQPGIES